MCGRESIIGTMQILLTEECRKEGGLRNEPLYWLLLNEMVYRDLSAYSISAIKENYQLIIEMFNMYIEYAADIRGKQIFLITTIINAAFAHIKDVQMFRNQRTCPGSPFLDVLNAAMEGLGELFRIILVAVGGNSNDMCQIYYNRHMFESFIVIVSSSSKSGHSKTLMRAMLSALNVNYVKRLWAMLAQEIETLKADSIGMVLSQLPGTGETLLTSATNALELVSEIETPYRLQHLARNAIHRAREDRPLPSAAYHTRTSACLSNLQIN